MPCEAPQFITLSPWRGGGCRRMGKVWRFPALVRSAFLIGLVTIATMVDGAAAAEIVVHGNRRIDADAIRAHFHAAPGASLDANTLDAALKELYATGAFEDVNITRSGSSVVVTVVEAPVIGRVAFEGNKK